MSWISLLPSALTYATEQKLLTSQKKLLLPGVHTHANGILSFRFILIILFQASDISDLFGKVLKCIKWDDEIRWH